MLLRRTMLPSVPRHNLTALLILSSGCADIVYQWSSWVGETEQNEVQQVHLFIHWIFFFYCTWCLWTLSIHSWLAHTITHSFDWFVTPQQFSHPSLAVANWQKRKTLVVPYFPEMTTGHWRADGVSPSVTSGQLLHLTTWADLANVVHFFASKERGK